MTVSAVPHATDRRIAALESAIRSHVVDHAGAYFPELGGAPRVTLVRHAVASSDVLFFRVETERGAREVVAKVPRLPDPGHEGRRELERFRAFNAANADPTVACPRALDYIEPLHALLTERVDGVGLAAALRGRGAAPEILVRGCASWLRAYHALAPARELPLWDLYFEYAERFAAYLGGSGEHAGERNRHPIPARLRGRIDDALGRIAAARSALRMRHVVGHGDFGPANILAAGTRVVVLDCPALHLRPALEDVAFFLVTALDEGGSRRASSRGRLRRIFLDAYGTDGLSAHEAGLDVLLLLAHLKRWSNQYRRANALPVPAGRAAAAWLARRHARRVGPLLERLERAL